MATNSNPQDHAVQQLLGTMRVFDESDNTHINPPLQKLLESTESDFRAVATVVNFGLSMLETDVGMNGIEEIGRFIIKSRKTDQHIYHKQFPNMKACVKEFLKKLRENFISVRLTNRLRGEGALSKANWAEDGATMTEWLPYDAGLLKLNKMNIKNMVRAGLEYTDTNDDNQLIAFERFAFLMGVTVAHELMHLFVGFLTGYERPSTPEEVTYLPELYNKWCNGEKLGESGRAWEGFVLGGVLEAFEEPGNSLGPRQAGQLFVFDSQKKARLLNRDCVQSMLRGDFRFPLRTDQTPLTTVDDVNKNLKTMQTIRRSEMSPELAQWVQTWGRERDSIQTAELKKLNESKGHDIREREFELVRYSLTKPANLRVAA